MPMNVKFGSLGEKTEGLFKRVNWPSLATMDERTGDGRLLVGEGGGVRDLPRTGFVQFVQSYGHDGSVAALRLDTVEFHEDGNISGAGWIADTDEGHKLAVLMAAKVLFHNSVDLTEIEAEYKWESDDPADPGFWNLLGLDFTQWNIAATTIVGKPAFANARAEIVASLLTEESTLDEIVAALECDDDLWAEITAALASDDDLEGAIDGWSITCSELDKILEGVEVVAGAIQMPWADFHMPETPTLQKIVVTADGCVFGHLDDINGRHGTLGIRPPHVIDNFASFNQAGPLTERGQVETGPIFFLGGHPDHPLGARTANQAYGGIENAWADVRVTHGRLGTWISGRVRPGLSEEAIHAARCSRISGHWKDGHLVAIVSVNVPAFNIPGTGLSADRGGAEYRDGKLEVVASLYGPDETPETALAELEAARSDISVASATLSTEQIAEIVDLVTARLRAEASDEPVDPNDPSGTDDDEDDGLPPADIDDDAGLALAAAVALAEFEFELSYGDQP